MTRLPYKCTHQYESTKLAYPSDQTISRLPLNPRSISDTCGPLREEESVDAIGPRRVERPVLLASFRLDPSETR